MIQILIDLLNGFAFPVHRIVWQIRHKKAVLPFMCNIHDIFAGDAFQPVLILNNIGVILLYLYELYSIQKSVPQLILQIGFGDIPENRQFVSIQGIFCMRSYKNDKNVRK